MARMGIKQSPNFTQEIIKEIKEVICGLDEAKVYINDVSTFNNNWDLSQLRSLDQVLK
jgi:hypothetical protein